MVQRVLAVPQFWTYAAPPVPGKCRLSASAWCYMSWHHLWLQEERSEVLWRSLERVIPDIRARAEVVQIGARGPCCTLTIVIYPISCIVRTSLLILNHAALV